MNKREILGGRRYPFATDSVKYKYYVFEITNEMETCLMSLQSIKAQRNNGTMLLH